MTKNFKIIFKDSRINAICFIVFVVSIILGILSYLVNPEEWSWPNLFLNLAISLFQLFLAILIVNIYLSSVNKEKVNAAGLFFVDGVIGKFHNHLMDLLVPKFGEEELLNVIDDFQNHGFKANKISEDRRNKIIEAIRKDFYKLKDEAIECILKIEKASKAGAFSNNIECLAYYLSAREYVSNFIGLQIDKPDEHTAIVESLLKADWQLHQMRYTLAKEAGIKLTEKED